MNPLLEVLELETRFDTKAGTVRSVDKVSFRIDKGELLCLVGESGCGKSVTALSIMGLISEPGRIVGGKIIYKGEDLTKAPQSRMREIRGNDIAMIFQDPMTSLNPVMRIGKQIAEPLRIHLDMSKQDARATALRLLQDVGIPEAAKRLDQYPHELSGGMRQRVMIAMALACGPTLLFADEPTTALDVTVQSQILELIRSQRRERNMSVILVTHDLGVVAGHTDEIMVMYAGKIVEQAPTSVLFAEMRMPYTEALMRSIPKLDQPSHTKLQAIGGRPPNLISPPAGCRFSPRCPYATEQCHQEEPPLVEESPGHRYACWHPVGSPRWHDVNDRAGTDGSAA